MRVVAAAFALVALGGIVLFLAERQLESARSDRVAMDKQRAGALEKVAKASEAQARMETSRHIGKIVLTI